MAGSEVDRTDLQRRYLASFSADGVPTSELARIEDRLGVRLPQDFCSIAKFYRGGLLGDVSHNAIADGGAADNIVEETLRVRNAVDLPDRYLVLAEPPGSIIVLDSVVGGVKWLDAADVIRLSTGEKFSAAVQEWPSYSSFFEYLLDCQDA